MEEAVCSALGIRKLRHRSALLALRLPDHVDLADMVFGVIWENWIAGRAAENMTRSRQNWRWSLQTYIGEANRSPEVMLEQAVAAACEAAGSSDWANQIPVASGLIAGARDNRRAIDLVHRRDTRTYEMIELKIASDTPLAKPFFSSLLNDINDARVSASRTRVTSISFSPRGAACGRVGTTRRTATARY